jgi:3-oxoacyl-[acyl-carrier-protein] synthase II
MNLKRVVITGLGALTPIGNCIPDFWNGIITGVSGANPITHFNPEKFKTKFACELKGFHIHDFIDTKDARKMDSCTQYALVASMEAIKDSAISMESIEAERIGVILGTGAGGITTVIDPLKEFYSSDGTPRFSPFFIPKVLADMVSGVISIRFGFKGPNYVTTSACASSANSIIDAFHFIQLGKADVMLTGGAEACISEPVMGGFNGMHALSTRNDDYKTASRPFDLGRDGFVMGEGAAIIVLEEYEHALKRGAKIYAEMGSYGLSADAYHITLPHPDGIGALQCMQHAIKDAGLQLSDIDYINAHGTSTPPGDLAECKAIANLFEEHASHLFVSSTKSMTGHLLGAAAAAESIISILAIYHGIVPPTINQFEADPALPDLNFVKNTALKKEIKTVISNSFGFGGHNASLLFKKLK